MSAGNILWQSAVILSRHPQAIIQMGMTDIVITSDGLRYDISKMRRQLTNLPISFNFVRLINEGYSLESISGRMRSVSGNMGSGGRVSCRTGGSDSSGFYGSTSSRVGGKREPACLGYTQVSNLALSGCLNCIPRPTVVRVFYFEKRKYTFCAVGGP
jgi:hypothetical protein